MTILFRLLTDNMNIEIEGIKVCSDGVTKRFTVINPEVYTQVEFNARWEARQIEEVIS